MIITANKGAPKYISGRLLKQKEVKMITKEVNEWLRKVEKGNYSTWDIMEEFANFTKHLTREEMEQIKKRLNSHVK